MTTSPGKPKLHRSQVGDVRKAARRLVEDLRQHDEGLSPRQELTVALLDRAAAAVDAAYRVDDLAAMHRASARVEELLEQLQPSPRAGREPLGGGDPRADPVGSRLDGALGAPATLGD